MAMNQSPLLEMLDALKAADADEFIRRMLAMMLQEMINATAMIMMGTGPYVRSADRTTQHTGTRDRVVTTAVDDIVVRIPRCACRYWLGSGRVRRAGPEGRGGADGAAGRLILGPCPCEGW